MDKKVFDVLKKTKKAISLDKLFEKLEVTTEDEKVEIKEILDSLVSKYEVFETPNHNYIAMSKTSYRRGHFYGNKNGSGRVVVTVDYIDGEGKHVVYNDEYLVDKDSALGAIDGDEVLIDIANKDRKGNKVGVVKDILSRDLEYIAGEVYRVGNAFFVKPVDKKKQNITIALNEEAIEGQRVEVALTESNSNNFYTGKIVRTFDHKDDPQEQEDDDILWEALKMGITNDFSDESILQLQHIPNKVLDTDKIGRHDITDWEIFTIDGKDTKDIDDALSCKVLPNGNRLVGVHIADVSHYIPWDSPLDKDARRKGTSSYLGGKVLPMFPHQISNGICSLNPNVDRLAMSVIMEVDKNGHVVNRNIWLSVINSKLKMTYDSVNGILKDGVVPEEYSEHADTLRELNKLALVLRKNRIKKGAVEFDRPELKVVLDENGILSGIDLRVQDVGENLIEEFMLLANENVDEMLEKNGSPVVHRVHDVPNEERMLNFLNLLEAVGYPFTKYGADELCSNKKALQELTAHIRNTGNLANMLSLSLVRCMSRAKYSHINIGHNGLAKENYCHFTSPIRRYPDLTVHRIVKDCLMDPENWKRNQRKWETRIPEICYHSSKMERASDDAEMEVFNRRCAKYMQQFVGQEFEATVIGLSDKGIQIQLDSMIEGRVRPKYLPGDYEYNPETFSLLSLGGNDDYYIGDRLSVTLRSSDPESKHIDFSINGKVCENKLIGVASKNKAAKVMAKTRDESKKKKTYR